MEGKTRILDLYYHPPADGWVICVDEFGPLNLQPCPGRGWCPRGRPARLCATYTRTARVRQTFAALALTSGQMFYRFRDASAGRSSSTSASSSAAASLREASSGLRHYGPHGKAEVRT